MPARDPDTWPPENPQVKPPAPPARPVGWQAKLAGETACATVAHRLLGWNMKTSVGRLDAVREEVYGVDANEKGRRLAAAWGEVVRWMD